MGGQRHPHAIGVGLPPTGRTLDIGEQKRHHPRRSSRPISGHPRRISQATRSTSNIGGSGPVNPSLVPAGRKLEQSVTPIPTVVNRAIINCGDRPAASRAPTKEGVTWRRTGPPATPVPITHASPRATTMSTTRHTTCRPGRCAKLLHHIESIPHRGYSSARAGTMATTRPTISAPDDQPRPESAYMSELFRLGPGHRRPRLSLKPPLTCANSGWADRI